MTNQDASLNLLILKTNGNRFGLDAAQIGEMIEPQDVERLNETSSGRYRILYKGDEIPIVKLADRIGLKGQQTYTTPKIVIPKSDRSKIGFLIEDPETIVPVTIDDIELFPELVERVGVGPGIWGIAKRHEHLIILIDLMEAGDADGAMT